MPTVWPWPVAETGVDDGVGFDVLADAPGEEERAELFGGGVAGGDGLEVGLGDAEVVGVLDEEAAGDLLEDAGGVGGGDLEEAEVFLGGEAG